MVLTKIQKINNQKPWIGRVSESYQSCCGEETGRLLNHASLSSRAGLRDQSVVLNLELFTSKEIRFVWMGAEDLNALS